MPGTSVVDVWQLIADNAAMQSTEPPDLKVTVPVASPGRPATDSVSFAPYAMVAGAADSVIAVSALVTVKLAPIAVAPL